MSHPPGQLAGRRIVVVEDHDDSREMLRHLLEAEGAVVVDTPFADTAILALYAAPVDVMLTDVSLRGSSHDGIWLMREARGSARLARIPIIAMTGHKERQTELRRLGFAAVLVKPFEPTELGAFILRCLEAKREP
jgi:two-component system phosphate regulon response regulator PhoB